MGVIQQATAGSATQTGTSLSVTLGAAPVAGRLLTVHLVGDKNLGTVTPPTGFTLSAHYSGLSVTAASAWKKSDGTETTALTWTWTTGEGARVAAIEHDATNPVAVAAGFFPNPVNDTAVSSVAGSIAADAASSGYAVATLAIDSTDDGLTGTPWYPAGDPTFTNMTRCTRDVDSDATAGIIDAGQVGLAVAYAPLTAGQTLSTTAAWTGGTDQAGLVMASFATSSATPSVSSPWLGAVTTTAGTVVCKSANVTSARLVVSTTSDLATAPIYSASIAPDTQGVLRLPVSGLAAGTTYFYGVEMDGSTTTAALGDFATAPTTATSFSFAFGSCRHGQRVPAEGSAAFTAVRNSGAAFFVEAGDFHYENQSATEKIAVQDWRNAWDTVVTDPTVQPLLATLPTFYAWDDHDYDTVDNGNRDSLSRANVAQVFRERVPHLPLPATDNVGIWQTFTWGRVRIILLDVRSQRSPQADPDDATKTMLGTEQKSWLYSTLDNSSEPVVVVFSGVPWVDAKTAGADTWGGYDTERTEIINEITNRGHAGRVAIAAGDMHALATKVPEFSPGGFPVYQAGPLGTTSSHKGGPWSTGPYPATTGVYSEQFGLVTITDTGGDSISVAFSGRSADNVEHVTLTTSFTAATTTLAAPSITSVDAISSSQLDVNFTLVSGATGYDVERDGVIVATGVTASPYSDTELTALTTYSYRVRATA